MRTRSAVAGVIVAVIIGGLGTAPVAADDDPAPDPAATTSTTEQTAPTDDGSGAAADPATGTDTTPVPDASTDPAPAADPGAGTATPAAPGPGTATEDAATDPAPSGGSTAGGTATAPTAPAATAQAAAPTGDATAAAPAGAPVPSTLSTQDATVDAASTAVADSGHDSATNGTVQVILVGQDAGATGGAGGAATDPVAGNAAGGDNTGVGLALVVTGDATATGGATSDTISQKALVKAVGTGEIEIIQIALVVNLGVGVANTGGNSATGLDAVNVIGVGQDAQAGPGGAGGVATNGLTAANDATGAGSIATGDATAVGNANTVRVVQAADAQAGAGLVASDQATDITSLGVAFGNTGLNLVIGNAVIQLILVDQAAAGGSGGSGATASNQATASNSATGLAGITTGAATATGLQSATGIDQLASAEAGDGGFVSILQRALVLNLGIALANTGMNTAVGNQSVNLVDLQQQSIAGAFWASLQSLFGGTGWLDLTGASGTATNSVTAANSSDGTALVTTGDAGATGLASTTQVAQTADGSAAAGGQALITQDATVTNAGLAVANSGANAAAGLLALNAVVADQWAGLGTYLAGYLAQLGSGTATAAPATSSWALGDVLVDLFGEIQADEVLIDGLAGLSGGQVEAAVAQALGFASGLDGPAATGPTAAGPRVRVRQVTGTLTINLGIASTGSNTARTGTVNVVVVDQAATPANDAQVTRAVDQGVRAAVQAAAAGAPGAATGDAALDPANLAVLVNATTGAAVVVTGDARAANATVVSVCQTFEVSTAVCSPPTPPTPPGPPDPALPAAAGGSGRPLSVASAVAAPRIRSASVASGTAHGRAQVTGDLPRTGADVAPLALAGVLLVGAGAVLVLTTGRRRALRRTVTTATRGGGS